MAGVLERLQQLDTSLFAAIASQTTPDDKASLLALQTAVGETLGSYTYLEIGSHLGGSIQPHLLDDRCRRIWSIDKRPILYESQTGYGDHYAGNSTARMLDNLRKIHAPGLAKLETIDADASQIDPARIGQRPEVLFIDGEHTDAAAKSDFAFCTKVKAPSSVVYFHDAAIVFLGIQAVLRQLEEQGTAFRAYFLPSTLVVLEFGDLCLHRHPLVQRMLLGNVRGYLYSLRWMEHYRQFYNKPAIRFLRRAKEVIDPREWLKAKAGS